MTRPPSSRDASTPPTRTETPGDPSQEHQPPTCQQVSRTGHGTPIPDSDDLHPMYCQVTGMVTDRPPRGPRAQYVSREVQKLRAGIWAVQRGVEDAAREWGFTADAARNLRRDMAYTASLARPDTLRSPERRRRVRKASVRLSTGVQGRVDALPGPSRAAKVETLLLEALNTRAQAAAQDAQREASRA